MTVPPSHDRAPALNGSRNRAALTAKRDAEGDGRLDSPPAPSALPSPLMVAIDRRLAKWRKRDLSDPKWSAVGWYGVNLVRQGLTDDKAEAREALEALVASGRAHKWEGPSGILWSGAPRDVIDVR